MAAWKLPGEVASWVGQLSAVLERRSAWRLRRPVAGGAYAERPFLPAALALRVVLVSRLRQDAALWSVPAALPPGQRQRGQPRRYGEDKISLAKRAGQRQGWQVGAFELYRVKVRKQYKTFLARYKPVGGVIRVVLVKESHGWFGYFCTKAAASVPEFLEAVADRTALEQNFHDRKEVQDAGQQQLRNTGPTSRPAR